MRPSQEADAANLTANPGYALGRLARAFATSQEHLDPDTRARAQKKVEDWTKVYEGMLSGTLQVGSRTPVAGTPPWATLEVAHGGFATGELLAGGALQPHEQELLAKLGERGGTERAALNCYYLGDEGLAELRRMLASGCYRVNVPEDGALLVAAWLVGHGHLEQARSLLDAIGPFLGRLRFYPVPDSRPLTDTSVVHLRSVRQMGQELAALQVSPEIRAQREAIQVWTPLCDRAVALFVETLEGPVPSLQTGPDGMPLRTAAGKFFIEGGWPCQHYPDGWQAQARALLDNYRRERVRNGLCGKPERQTENFFLLRRCLETCVEDPRRLTGREVGTVRFILASIAWKRGLPGSERCQRLRDVQARVAARPTTAEIARVLVARLARLPQDDGLDSLEPVLAAVNPEEAEQYKMKSGQAIPGRLGLKLRRCLAAPVEILVEMGVVPSGEVLAQVVPQITAQVRSAGLADPELRRLYGAIYRAFRRRRSLLLLNLQSQVKLEELPWVAAINFHRRDGLDAREQARQTLEQVVVLAITAFPQQILPNKLLQEIRALADGAGLRIPIVDEVAADIFMGTFSEKYLRAARKAADLLQGTLYERYYGIPYGRVRQIDDVKPSRHGAATSPAFASLCSELAGGAGGGWLGKLTGLGGWSVAGNGKIIEQEQILTTHNLAVLFDALGLSETLRPRLDDLARRCFEWTCRRQQQKIDPWKAKLQMVKNTAYAWRQMVFFLALLPGDAVEVFLGWAFEHLAKQRADYQAGFRPALDGLVEAARGGSPQRRFLGWTTEKHWLLA